jgi:hypothetical protein
MRSEHRDSGKGYCSLLKDVASIVPLSIMICLFRRIRPEEKAIQTRGTMQAAMTLALGCNSSTMAALEPKLPDENLSG